MTELDNRKRHKVLWALPGLFLVAVLVVMILYAVGCGRTAEPVPEYVFTYAENQTADYPTTQGAHRFAELVQERTNGRIQIQIHTNAELGDEVSALKQVKLGGIDFARASLSTLTDYCPESMTLMLPYIYRNADHMWTVLDGEIGQEVMAGFEGTGIFPLSWYDAGVRHFYMREEADSMEDLAGKKIRVQPSPMMMEMVRLLGAQPVPINYEDVYAALETGEVDGAENNWSSYEAMRHDRVAPYILLDGHMRVPEMQVISQTTMDQLSEEDQQIILDCARESALYERRLWTEREKTSREQALASGVQEITLSEEEQKKFHDCMQPLYEEYCGNYMDLVKRIEEAQ